MIGNAKTSCYRIGDIHDRKIIKDDKVVYRATEATNNLGVYVKGNKLYDNGRLVAVSSKANPQIKQGEHLMFGEVRLDTDGVCINITLENYNKLYNREEVPGYKYFDPYDVYNIVDDPTDDNIEPILYERDGDRLIFTKGELEVEWPYTTYVLANNVFGETQHNVEDLDNTVKMYNSPYVSIRYFNPRITVGDTIKIPFAVDNYFAEYIQGRTVEIEQDDETVSVFKQNVTGPYTIEVCNQGDSTKKVVKTVYAGESLIETKAFNSVGETWFSIRCIDSNGVCSAEHHLDVLVEPVNAQPNIWDLSTNPNADSILESYGITFDDGTSVYPTIADDDEDTYQEPVEPLQKTDYQNLVEAAYLNKKGFTDLFAYAVTQTINGAPCTGIKLPKYRYPICDYRNQSSNQGEILLNNDTAKYFYCVIENVVDENNNIIGNKITSVQRYTEKQVITDAAGIFTTNGVVDYKNFLTYTPRRKNDTKYPALSMSDIEVNATDIYYYYYNYSTKSGSYKRCEPGGWYFVFESTAKSGDSIIFPDNFTLDLNDSLIYVIPTYDIRGESSDGVAENETRTFDITRATNVTIKNGTLRAGLIGYDWRRAVARQHYKNPCEQMHILWLRGARFMTFDSLNIEETLGYTLGGSVDTYDNRQFALSYVNVYDDKKLNIDLEDENAGEIEDIANYVDNNLPEAERFESLVISVSTGNVNDIGYIPLKTSGDRANDKYIYIGRTEQWVTQIGKRKEIFVLFYDSNSDLINVVKTRTTWMVRIPEDAVKIRIMGYGHSSNKAGVASRDASTWRDMGVYQVRSSSGNVFKNCTFYRNRSSIVGGSMKQTLYDNVLFKEVAAKKWINHDNIGFQTAITALCVDLESGAPFAKYMAFNNIRTELAEVESDFEQTMFNSFNSYLGVNSFTLQGGEDIQITNSTLSIADWGLWSGLIKNNTLTRTYDKDDGFHGRALDLKRHPMFVFHRFVQWDNNTIDPKSKARSIVQDVTQYGSPKGNPNVDVLPEYYFNDTYEVIWPLRFTTVTTRQYDSILDFGKEFIYIKYRNSKDKTVPKTGYPSKDVYFD